MTYRIGEIEKSFKRWSEKIEKNVAEKQRQVAIELCEEVKSRAPINTGRYVSSIKVGETKIENHVITTEVYTDLLVGGDNPKWANKPLGAFLEWGTGIKGANTGKAGNYGHSYRLTPWAYFSKELGHWVTTTGIIAVPHFFPALQLIKSKYKYYWRH